MLRPRGHGNVVLGSAGATDGVRRGLKRVLSWGGLVLLILLVANAIVLGPRIYRTLYGIERFEATVWNNVSGDVLTDDQRRALRGWIEAGGGFVGIHGSGGDPRYAWSWYVDRLIGTQFSGHPINPQFQQATLVIEDREHPATRHLDPTWVRTHERYSFAGSPRSPGIRVLATLDEGTPCGEAG